MSHRFKYLYAGEWRVGSWNQLPLDVSLGLEPDERLIYEQERVEANKVAEVKISSPEADSTDIDNSIPDMSPEGIKKYTRESRDIVWAQFVNSLKLNWARLSGASQDEFLNSLRRDKPVEYAKIMSSMRPSETQERLLIQQQINMIQDPYMRSYAGYISEIKADKSGEIDRCLKMIEAGTHELVKDDDGVYSMRSLDSK